MKKLISVLIICIFTSSAFSVDLYSIANGDWNNGSVWSYTPNGPPCYCSPSSADNIIINHHINLTLHLINQGSNQNGITGVLTINAGASLTGNYDIDIRSSGTLIVCGTLDVRNVIFSNGSVVEVCSTGNLIINGTFENKNNSNTVTINGNMTVHGTFTNGNGGIVSGSGNLTLMSGPATNTGTTFGCTGMDPCTSYPCIVEPCTVLPIQLISFNATTKNKSVELEWATATEKNNDFFTVEKSIDGIEYIPVATYKGAGNSEYLLLYNATDNTPYPGISYYRLKQTDFDGKYTYSLPVAVRIQTSGSYQLIPNPSNGHNVVVVLPDNDATEIKVLINDITGRIVSERIVKPESGKKKSTFLLTQEKSLKEGIYLVNLTMGGESFIQKLIIN
jgi:hypothetical protein